MEIFSSPPKRNCNVPSPLLLNEEFPFSNHTTSDSDSGRGASPRNLSVSGYDRSPDIYGLAGSVEEAPVVPFGHFLPGQSLPVQQVNLPVSFSDSPQHVPFGSNKPLFGSGGALDMAENPFSHSQVGFRFSPLMDT